MSLLGLSELPSSALYTSMIRTSKPRKSIPTEVEQSEIIQELQDTDKKLTYMLLALLTLCSVGVVGWYLATNAAGNLISIACTGISCTGLFLPHPKFGWFAIPVLLAFVVERNAPCVFVALLNIHTIHQQQTITHEMTTLKSKVFKYKGV